MACTCEALYTPADSAGSCTTKSRSASRWARFHSSSSDWTQETRFRRSAMARARGVTTSFSVAISDGERMHGILSVHSIEPRILSEDEILFVQSAAVSLAHAIARKRSQEQFRALVEHAPDAIVRFDRDLRIIYVNQGRQSAQSCVDSPPR